MRVSIKASILAAAALAPLFASGAALAQQSVDSGSNPGVSCTAAASISAGQAVCGLLQIPLARLAGGSGEIENVLLISAGGSTVSQLVRFWDRKPTSTTCTAGAAFVSNFNDDLHLIGPGPFSLVPSAPANTTGDAKTYASQTFTPPISFWNQDSPTTTYVYACIVAGAADTADQSNSVGLVPSGPRN
jgi:hypothetical protein